MEWYLKVLKNYTNFEGRAIRKEFWMFFLINLIISAILQVIDFTIFGMKKYNIESEFIGDIPSELVHRIETNLGIKSIFIDY